MHYETINSFEDACKYLKYDAAAIIPDVTGWPQWLAKFTISQIKRAVIVLAINEGKVVDYSDGTLKYEIIFYMDDQSSGFGLSFFDFVYSISLTYCGSRLSFFDKNAAKYFATHENFMELHRDALSATA